MNTIKIFVDCSKFYETVRENPGLEWLDAKYMGSQSSVKQYFYLRTELSRLVILHWVIRILFFVVIPFTISYLVFLLFEMFGCGAKTIFNKDITTPGLLYLGLMLIVTVMSYQIGSWVNDKFLDLIDSYLHTHWTSRDFRDDVAMINMGIADWKQVSLLIGNGSEVRNPDLIPAHVLSYHHEWLVELAKSKLIHGSDGRTSEEVVDNIKSSLNTHLERCRKFRMFLTDCYPNKFYTEAEKQLAASKTLI